ncbi:MAG: hypothetical protein KGO94_04870 [Alphaproteobacteria bacterium]|nr:hypothetical protein [Alphaproteobacteria bacterium]
MRPLLPALGLCAGLYIVAIPFGNLIAAPKATQQVIGLLVGESQWLGEARKLAAKLDHEEGMRVVPMLGVGGVQAFQDMSSLPGIDAALVASDSLAYASEQGLLAGQKDKFSYIAKLAPLNVVIVAKREIATLEGLKGKKIATGPAQSASFATAELLFNALNIDFTRVAKQDEEALDALNSGLADAAVILGTAQSTAVLSDGRFHVLDVQAPPSLSSVYQPAILTARELPGLVTGKQTVETISTSLTLAVHEHVRDAGRNKALKTFTSLVFNLPSPDGGDNLAAAVPGWQRHAEALKVLNQKLATKKQAVTISPTGGKP